MDCEASWLYTSLTSRLKAVDRCCFLLWPAVPLWDDPPTEKFFQSKSLNREQKSFMVSCYVLGSD